MAGSYARFDDNNAEIAEIAESLFEVGNSAISAISAF